MTTETRLPEDFLLSKKWVYHKLNLELKNAQPELESDDYKAFRCQLNDLFILYREAKITPTKTGQFVTLWKRKLGQSIEPFHVSDNIDFVIVSTRNEEKFGQFIFPKSVLIEKGIISTEMKEGKRAFRVYPPWDLAENKQAQASQKWQLNYFLTISNDGKVDVERVEMLFGC
jgi:hypothetical protein